jgi:hypothetical protein
MGRRRLCVFLTVVAGLCALGVLGGIRPYSSSSDGARVVVDSATSVPLLDAVAAPLASSARQLAHHIGNVAWLSRIFGLLAAVAFGTVLLGAAACQPRRFSLSLRSRAPPLP